MVLSSKSNEQRWSPKAGSSFPVFSLGTSTHSACNGCVINACVCWSVTGDKKKHQSQQPQKNSQVIIVDLLCLRKDQDQREGVKEGFLEEMPCGMQS